MKYILTFILGLLTALSALILQVFVGLIAEILFHTKNITFDYSPDDTTTNILLLIILAATTEEFVRYILIKYKLSSYITKNNIINILFYGFLFGIGFTSFEGLMSYFNNSISLETLYFFTPVVIIHCISSIFLLLTISRNSKISVDVMFIVLIILFHASANFILYNLMQ